jgi:hypothetical protein
MSYKEKYLKYKNKYINLKNIIGGDLLIDFNNKEQVLNAVNKDGLVLKSLSIDLKRDKEIILAAVNQNGIVLEFAHYDLQKDRDIVLAAVKQNGLALEFAHSINPQSKAIVESLLSISKNLLKPISYTNYDDKLVSHSLDSGSSKKIKEIYNKYFKLMEGIDPEYVNTIKKQEERAKNIKLIGLGVITLFIIFLFFNTCNKPNNLSNTENGSDVTNSNTETNGSINDQNVTEPSQYDLLRDAVSGATDSESSTSYSDGSMPMKDYENERVTSAEDENNYKVDIMKTNSFEEFINDPE